MKLWVSVMVSLLSWLSDKSETPSPFLNQFTKERNAKYEFQLSRGFPRDATGIRTRTLFKIVFITESAELGPRFRLGRARFANAQSPFALPRRQNVMFLPQVTQGTLAGLGRLLGFGLQQTLPVNISHFALGTSSTYRTRGRRASLLEQDLPRPFLVHRVRTGGFRWNFRGIFHVGLVNVPARSLR